MGYPLSLVKIIHGLPIIQRVRDRERGEKEREREGRKREREREILYDYTRIPIIHSKE